MKLMAGFYTEGLDIGANILEEKSLGGSESAFIYMSREFAKMGHDVKIFCNLHPDYHNIRRDNYGINWFDKSQFPEMNLMFQFDVFFCYRFFPIFKRKVNSKLNILVNHDVLQDAHPLMIHAWQIDHLFNLSAYHKKIYVEKEKLLEPFIWQTKNGVDAETIRRVYRQTDTGRKNRLIYASRPERGLDRLLRIWDETLRDRLKEETKQDWELVVCGYDLQSLSLFLDEDMVAFYKAINMQIQSTEGVHSVGNLKKEDFWKLLKSCKMLVYPTHFPEISCIAALESMLCGTPVITTNNFALPETIADCGILIDGNPDSKEYEKKFVSAICDLAVDKHKWYDLSQRGMNRIVNHYDWKQIAKSWHCKILELLSERFDSNKETVIDNLIYYSDLVAANKLAIEYDLKYHIKKTDDLIEKTKSFNQEFVEEAGKALIFLDRTDMKYCARFAEVIEWITEVGGIKTILDVGCNNGSFTISASNVIPDLKIHGIDFSEGCVEKAEYFKNQASKYKDNVTFEFGDIKDYKSDKKYDAIFAGELLEHMVDTPDIVDKLENHVKDDGWVFITVPNGPWDAQTTIANPKRNTYHVHHFDLHSIKDIFGNKKKFRTKFIPGGMALRGERLGWWAIAYQKSSAKCGDVNFEYKKFTRPYQYISCGIITRNEENNVGRCLSSIKNLTDEIIVCDTGSTDDTIRIAQKYTDKVYNISNDPDNDGLFDFSWARNETLERISPKAKWFLWIDADEELLGTYNLKKYLDTPIYKGYVIKQNHLVLDIKRAEPDTPVRIFKVNEGIRFCGTIHEMPMESINENVHPTLILPDVDIAHYGYLTEGIRRDKCAKRNLQLLLKDRVKNPDRRMSLVLLMRDYWNAASWEMQAYAFATDNAKKYLRTACDIWNQEFKNRYDDTYYGLAFGLYQQILERMAAFGIPVDSTKVPPLQVALTLAGRYGGLNSENFESHKYWFADGQEYIEFIDRKSKELLEKLNTTLEKE